MPPTLHWPEPSQDKNKGKYSTNITNTQPYRLLSTGAHHNRTRVVPSSYQVRICPDARPLYPARYRHEQKTKNTRTKI